MSYATAEYIMTPPKQYKKQKQAHRIEVIDGAEKDKNMQKQQKRAVIKLHRKTIKSLRADIRKQKLLIRQVKLNYKLSK